MGRRGKWDVPKAVLVVAGAGNDELAVLDDFDVEFGENDNAVVAEFSYGNQGPRFEAI